MRGVYKDLEEPTIGTCRDGVISNLRRCETELGATICLRAGEASIRSGGLTLEDPTVGTSIEGVRSDLVKFEKKNGL